MPRLRGILSLRLMFVKLERTQRKFASLGHHCFFSHLEYCYGNVLNYLKLHTISGRMCYVDVFF